MLGNLLTYDNIDAIKMSRRIILAALGIRSHKRLHEFFIGIILDALGAFFGRVSPSLAETRKKALRPKFSEECRDF